MFADRRYLLYLLATFFNAVVYVQYLCTLPLNVRAAGLDIVWYTAAVSLNGLIVIAFELPVTRFSQRLAPRLTIPASMALVGVGVACYGLPLGPAVILIGTLLWTMAELVGGPAIFAYPALAAPARLKGRYIGSFQFTFRLGTAVGPVIGGALFAVLGHGVWLVLALGAAAATLCALAAMPAAKPATELAASEGAA
jgi:MFS family permease